MPKGSAPTDAELMLLLNARGGGLDNLHQDFGGDMALTNRALGMLGSPYGAQPDLPPGEGQLVPGGAPGYGSYTPTPPDGNAGGGAPPSAGGGGDPFQGSDWSAYRPTPGQDTGVVPDYQPNYAPGQDATWGQEGVPGNNRDFYAQQFANLNAQAQAHQQQALAAAMRSEAQPEAQPPGNWDWVQGGLKEPTVAGQDSYSLRDPFTPGQTTNRELIEWYQPRGDQGTQDFWKRVLEGSGSIDQSNWGSAGDPNKLIGQLDNTGANRSRYIDLFNAIYNQTGDYTGPGDVPAGYAAPI